MLAFNRGRFNRPTKKSTFFTGKASIELVATATMNTVSNFSGAANIVVIALDRSIDGALIGIRASGQVSRVRLLGEASDPTRQAKFNRMGFNRGKFNASAHKRSNASISMAAAGILTAARSFDGEAEIIMNTESGALNTSSTFGGEAEIDLITDGNMNATRTFRGAANIVVQAIGRMNMIHDFDGAAFITLETTSQEFNTFRIEYIELPNLTLEAGDELIIDTDRKTITLNGVNIMRYLSRASEFFNFNPRENEIEYLSSNPNDQVEIRILWKDAWL